MPKLFVVAIRDSAQNAYVRPFFPPSLGLAERGFRDEVNREAEPQANPMYHHPEDFELHQLGAWHEETGVFEQLDHPQLIARGKDVSTRFNTKG